MITTALGVAWCPFPPSRAFLLGIVLTCLKPTSGGPAVWDVPQAVMTHHPSVDTPPVVHCTPLPQDASVSSAIAT